MSATGWFLVALIVLVAAVLAFRLLGRAASGRPTTSGEVGTVGLDDGARAEIHRLLAADKKIANVPLTVFDGTAGPESYKISKDAAVNVMMWNKMTVQVNEAFGAGKLTKDDVSKIAGETKKILE